MNQTSWLDLYPNTNIDKQSFNFAVKNKNQNDTLSINYNLKFPKTLDYNLKVMSILSVVNVKDSTDIKSIKLKSFSSDKNQTFIYIENNSKSNLCILIHIKICYTYSFIQTYFLLNFASFCKDREIQKLSKNQIKNILINKYLKYDNYSQVIKSLFIWLEDIKNVKSKVNSLLEQILWDKVPQELILEFLLKFHHLIENLELNKILQNSIDSRVNLNYSKFLLKTV